MVLPVMETVESSNIKSIGYKEGNLYVIFSETPYVYSDVPVDEYERFKESDSKGSYFASYIKNVYQCTKLDA